MEWRHKQVAPEKAARLAADLEVPPLLAQLLINRGLENGSEALDFLNPSLAGLPSPRLLPGLEKAVDLLSTALRDNAPVTVYGDYDADGLTATALLAGFFKKIGLNVNTYTPHRLNEGYGLHAEALETLSKAGTRYVVTVDLGISDHAAAQRARELGLKLIITDHHNPPETLPAAEAIINPKLKGSPHSLRELAGVGVAFFLAGGLRQAFKDSGLFDEKTRPELAPHLGLVALGTVADVAPLTQVNRVLVAEGLKHLAATASPGLAALKEISALPAGRPLTAVDIGFRLAPRLNAIGRLGSPQPGLDLLLTEDPDQARALAEILEQNNRKRKELQETVVKEAITLLEEAGPDRKIIILGSENWHRGVVGIAASKLVDIFHRPAILMSFNENLALGSARSIQGFSIFKALCQLDGLLMNFGGHDLAAGLTLEAGNLASFTEAIEAIANAAISREDLLPRLNIEAEAGLRDLSQNFMFHLSKLQPFGPGNPEPVIAVHNLNCLSAAIVGQNHLKLRLEQNGQVLQTIGFGLGGLLPNLGPRVSAALTPQVSTYQGQTTQSWQVLDIKKAE